MVIPDSVLPVKLLKIPFCVAQACINGFGSGTLDWRSLFVTLVTIQCRKGASRLVRAGPGLLLSPLRSPVLSGVVFLLFSVSWRFLSVVWRMNSWVWAIGVLFAWFEKGRRPVDCI